MASHRCWSLKDGESRQAAPKGSRLSCYKKSKVLQSFPREGGTGAVAPRRPLGDIQGVFYFVLPRHITSEAAPKGSRTRWFKQVYVIQVPHNFPARGTARYAHAPRREERCRNFGRRFIISIVCLVSIASIYQSFFPGGTGAVAPRRPLGVCRVNF